MRAREPTEHPKHVALRPECGICGVRLQGRDPCVVLVGNKTSSGLFRITTTFPFPASPCRNYAVEDLLLCSDDAQCERHSVSPDAATAHVDCYEVLARGCDAAEHGDDLWTAAAWRAPWRHCRDLRLDASPVHPDAEIAGSLGLSAMSALPAEIRHAIWAHSSSAPFWRYSAARHLARQLSSTPLGDIIRLPLCDVSYWERGSLPVVDPIDQDKPTRLVIDTHGLRLIERLDAVPPVRTWRTNKQAFAIIYPDDYYACAAYFRFGLARLVPHLNSVHGFKLWDTPTSPPLSSCTLSVPEVPPSSRFQTINLQSVTGLTFFYFGSRLHGAHGHTPDAPVASPPPWRLRNGAHLRPKWVYVPISKRDSVVAMGTRQPKFHHGPYKGVTLLIRLELAGDVIVGTIPDPSYAHKDVSFGANPLLLVTNTIDALSETRLGAYTPPSDAPVPAPFPYPTIQRHFNGPCYSAAPLSHVIRALVFHEEGTQNCRGILFHYANGGKRAVGECRVGAHPSISFPAPARICLADVADNRLAIRREREPPLRGAMVRFSAGKDHGHREEDWVCYGMRGEVRFWFTSEETKVVVHEE